MEFSRDCSVGLRSKFTRSNEPPFYEGSIFNWKTEQSQHVKFPQTDLDLFLAQLPDRCRVKLEPLTEPEAKQILRLSQNKKFRYSDKLRPDKAGNLWIGNLKDLRAVSIIDCKFDLTLEYLLSVTKQVKKVYLQDLISPLQLFFMLDYLKTSGNTFKRLNARLIKTHSSVDFNKYILHELCRKLENYCGFRDLILSRNDSFELQSLQSMLQDAPAISPLMYVGFIVNQTVPLSVTVKNGGVIIIFNHMTQFKQWKNVVKIRLALCNSAATVPWGNLCLDLRRLITEFLF